MKQENYTKKELLKRIKEKKELSGLTDSVVEEVLDTCLERHGVSSENLDKTSAKVLLKDVRAELRKHAGRFQKSLKSKEKLLEANNIRKLLLTHSSTSERIDFYPKLKKIISSLNVSSILDLGCGLNPIALASPNVKYYASDIKEDELSLIERFFRKNKIKGKTFVCNLKKITIRLPKADLCLLFKVLDVIDDKSHKLTEQILSEIPCRYFLISFSTRKLSGKPMNHPERVWFEKILRNQNLNFR